MEDVRRPSAFQAGDVRGRSSRDGGRRSYAWQLQRSAAVAGRRAPILKSVLAPESRLLSVRFTAPDPNGWQIVVKKRKRKPPSKKPRPSRGKTRTVPADLVGLCFNCFRHEHISRNCPYPSCCLRCWELGHAAHDSAWPRLLLGDRRRARSRSRQWSPQPQVTGAMVGD
jgi:hypothetical protein